MKNSTKQVVILDNFASPYIQQAILILKEYNPALEDKIIQDAEKIVSGYFRNKNNHSDAPKKENRPGLFAWLFGALFISGVLIAATFIWMN